jgi:hypothetical protein
MPLVDRTNAAKSNRRAALGSNSLILHHQCAILVNSLGLPGGPQTDRIKPPVRYIALSAHLACGRRNCSPPVALRTAAAPSGPFTCLPVLSSARRMCSRSASGSVCSSEDAGAAASSTGTLRVLPEAMIAARSTTFRNSHTFPDQARRWGSSFALLRTRVIFLPTREENSSRKARSSSLRAFAQRATRAGETRSGGSLRLERVIGLLRC